MAFYYVRSTTGNDSFDGSSWVRAKQSIVGTLNIAVPGDTIYVSQVHLYTVAIGSDIIYPSGKGACNAPIRIICVNDANQPPTQLANTAIEQNLSTSNSITFNGSSSYIYWYGINFNCPLRINFPYNCTQIFDNCKFNITSNTQGSWNFDSGNTIGGFDIRFINSTFNSSYSGSSIYFVNSHSTQAYQAAFTLSFKGCIWTGASLTNLFTWNTSSIALSTNILIDSCDLSLFGSSSYLINCANIGKPTKIYIRNSKINSSMNLYTGSISGPQQPDIFIESCEASGIKNKYDTYRYQGTIKTSNSILKNNGATDGASGFSWIMSSNPYNNFAFPLESLDISTWCGTIGTQYTAAVSIMQDINPTLPASNYIMFDGTTGYLDGPTSADWTLGTDNFTLDTWVMFTNINVNSGLIDVGGSSTALSMLYYAGIGIQINWAGTSYYFNWAPSLSTWYHIAAVRNSNTLSVYVNGTFAGSTDVTGKTITTTSLRIGNTISGTSYYIKGSLSCIRITKGAALWTSNFTPPTSYTTDSNTKLYIKPSSTTSITDDATSKTITKTGTCYIIIPAVLGTGDIWMDFEYQGSSTTPISSFISSRTLGPLSYTNSTTYDTDTDVTWTAPGINTPTPQKMQVQFTPQMKGVARLKIYLAKPNCTVYIDPSITII